MAINMVVVSFKDGTVMKGNTSDFSPNKKDFHLVLLSGEGVKIDTEQLKAIFFVKDFSGNKNRKDSYNDVIPGGGRKLYPRRVAIVEPVFANIRTQKRLDRFTLRGKIKATIQWLLYSMVHNIEKIANFGPECAVV